ncbi:MULTISPECIES: hypothetical protein [Polyangium]|uniref:Uncharacterized protein n=2 Tax=Polyangium TaxID=55 RepID=A0A4U1JIT6_9BACT|nr:MULTISPECIES: hypothetical protein [Polyangium]MDI1432960.1 hypothetical protein [Polyangium sorediatum]TKD12579.1 hypothetical protein E8A74_02155 [Polyangium fumosum]
MSAKNRPHTPAVAVAPREAAFQDAVVLVREPFVIDRAVAMQAIRYTKELLSGSFAPNTQRESMPSSNPSTSRRRAASGR